eukprot:5176389-Amphidinium_carterae.2
MSPKSCQAAYVQKDQPHQPACKPCSAVVVAITSSALQKHHLKVQYDSYRNTVRFIFLSWRCTQHFSQVRWGRERA